MSISGKILLTNTGERYLIVNFINLENDTYAFLTNINNQADSFFAKIGDHDFKKVYDTSIKEVLMNYLYTI